MIEIPYEEVSSRIKEFSFPPDTREALIMFGTLNTRIEAEDNQLPSEIEETCTELETIMSTFGVVEQARSYEVKKTLDEGETHYWGVVRALVDERSVAQIELKGSQDADYPVKKEYLRFTFAADVGNYPVETREAVEKMLPHIVGLDPYQDDTKILLLKAEQLYSRGHEALLDCGIEIEPIQPFVIDIWEPK